LGDHEQRAAAPTGRHAPARARRQREAPGANRPAGPPYGTLVNMSRPN